jgi:hypothetical protein
LMVVHVVVLSLCPHADAAQHESDDKKQLFHFLNTIWEQQFGYMIVGLTSKS